MFSTQALLLKHIHGTTILEKSDLINWIEYEPIGRDYWWIYNQLIEQSPGTGPAGPAQARPIFSKKKKKKLRGGSWQDPPTR